MFVLRQVGVRDLVDRLLFEDFGFDVGFVVGVVFLEVRLVEGC